MALAQLGFAVFVLDARGTPVLDCEARDATWGPNFGSADVVAADHATAVKQLAARYDFLDPERVGIYGHSWGGYYTVRLIAQRPDVFKVGVSSAAMHDNYAANLSYDPWFGLPAESRLPTNSSKIIPLRLRLEGTVANGGAVIN